MLQLSTTPARSSQTQTLPVAVFGSTPRKTWGAIVGRSNLRVLDTGESAFGGQRHKTPWIVTNHPDVTTYNCCPGDPSAKCAPSSGGSSNQELIKSEQTDFVAACWIRTMTGARPPTAAQAKSQCEAAWITRPSATHRQALCVQAKLDNQNSAARCRTYEQAWHYCAANQANACATLDCSYDEAKATLPLPPLSQRLAGGGGNCADRKY